MEIEVGCGGKNCTCCTKGPPAQMKKIDRKRSRHLTKKIELKQLLEEIEDLFEAKLI